LSRSIIVVPCYNEAQRLDAAAFRSFLAAQSSVCFVFVDDGSRDATGACLEALAKTEPERLRVLALAQNSGKAEAVRAGVRAALEERPDFVGYWDADLATPLAEIPKFVSVLEESPGLEAVFGARVRMLGRTIERHGLRHGLGRVFATAVARMLDLPVYDTQCGAKLFRVSDTVAGLFAEPFFSGWCFDVELIARWLRARRVSGAEPLTQVIRELPLERWTDVEGSKVRPVDFFRAWVQLWRIRGRYLR